MPTITSKISTKVLTDGRVEITINRSSTEKTKIFKVYVIHKMSSDGKNFYRYYQIAYNITTNIVYDAQLYPYKCSLTYCLDEDTNGKVNYDLDYVRNDLPKSVVSYPGRSPLQYVGIDSYSFHTNERKIDFKLSKPFVEGSTVSVYVNHKYKASGLKIKNGIVTVDAGTEEGVVTYTLYGSSSNGYWGLAEVMLQHKEGILDCIPARIEFSGRYKRVRISWINNQKVLKYHVYSTKPTNGWLKKDISANLDNTWIDVPKINIGDVMYVHVAPETPWGYKIGRISSVATVPQPTLTIPPIYNFYKKYENGKYHYHMEFPIVSDNADIVVVFYDPKTNTNLGYAAFRSSFYEYPVIDLVCDINYSTYQIKTDNDWGKSYLGPTIKMD